MYTFSKKNAFLIYIIFLAIACKSKPASENTPVNAEDSIAAQTPVTVTSIKAGNLSDSIELNATANFIQSNIIKSNINGYIEQVYVKTGQLVAQGHTLFTLKTKEARSLGNTINKLDPSFNFSGIVSIRAAQNGYITQLFHQQGDYVQDGEQLALLNDNKGFGFIMNVPYEYSRYVSLGKQVAVLLPDGTSLHGNIQTIMPSIDSISQTQSILVKVRENRAIPQNLIARVRILKSIKSNTVTLPKAAILTDEAQATFWVMKVTDSSTAVKVPIIKGMETGSDVEVISPKFSNEDKFVLSGNYGLPDTAKIKIIRSE